MESCYVNFNYYNLFDYESDQWSIKFYKVSEAIGEVNTFVYTPINYLTNYLL